MIFVNEFKRYFYLNLSNPKKTILPLCLNLFIIISIFLGIFKAYVTVEYIFAYLMVWLFMTVSTSIKVDIQAEIKNGRLKYYFLESPNHMVCVYFYRFILCLTKNVVLLALIIFLLKIVGLIEVLLDIKYYLFLFLEFVSIFGIIFILALFECLYQKIRTAINFLLIGFYLLMLINTSQVAPLGGIVNYMALDFMGLPTVNLDFVDLIINVMCYSVASYILSNLVVGVMKIKIIK